MSLPAVANLFLSLRTSAHTGVAISNKNLGIFLKKCLTTVALCDIMAKLSARYAAIAQSVERILGKDEVASSNLASSSKTLKLLEFRGFFLFIMVFHVLIPHLIILSRDEDKFYAKNNNANGSI